MLTIDPDSNLCSSVTYTVYVPAGAVKDLANNALASDYNFNFTTEEASTTLTITAPAGIGAWSLDPSLAQPQTQTGALSILVDPDSSSWEVTATDADTTNTTEG